MILFFQISRELGRRAQPRVILAKQQFYNCSLKSRAWPLREAFFVAFWLGWRRGRNVDCFCGHSWRAWICEIMLRTKFVRFVFLLMQDCVRQLPSNEGMAGDIVDSNGF